MSEITTDREEAAKQLASDATRIWRDLSPADKDEFRREAAKRIERDGGIRIHPSEDETNAVEYVSTALRSRLDELGDLSKIARGEDLGEYSNDEILALDLAYGQPGPVDASQLSEEAEQRLIEYPLCVEATITFEIVLGTGGPDDRLLFECEPLEKAGPREEVDSYPQLYEIRRVLYRYSWMGSAERALSGSDRETAEDLARRVVPELVE